MSAARVRLLGTDHPDSLSTRLEQGLVFKSLKRDEEAESVFTSALEGMRRTHGPRNPVTLTCASLLASIYLEQHRHDEAEALLSSIIGPMLDVLGEHHTEYRAAQYNLAAVVLARGDKIRALALLEQFPGGPPTDPSVDLLFKVLWNDPRMYAISNRVHLADPQRRMIQESEFNRLWYRERLDEAEKVITDLVHANRANLGLEHPETERATLNLVGLYSVQGGCDEARPLLEKMLDRQRSRLGAGSFEESETLWWLAHCEIADDRISEATALMDRVRTMKLRHGGPHSPTYLMAEAEYKALTGDLEGALDVARSLVFDREYFVRWNVAFKRFENDPAK